jgi:hypothetical protein
MREAYTTDLVGIEIGVEDNYSVRGIQVDSDASRPCGQNVDKDIRPWTIEFVYSLLTFIGGSVSIL